MRASLGLFRKDQKLMLFLIFFPSSYPIKISQNFKDNCTDLSFFPSELL